MKTITEEEFLRDAERYLSEAVNHPILITSEQGNLVLLSEKLYNSLKPTNDQTEKKD